MSLRLVLGGAGSGKTETILHEIVREVQERPLGKPLWLLVPEQATFQAEQALCRHLGGILRVRVVSFQRLAYLVMNNVAGAALTPINELGLTMLVRKVLEETKGELKPFVHAARQPGFAAQVVEIILQLKRQRITPDQMREIVEANAAKLSLAMADKLGDVLTIYTELLEKQHSRQILDSEDSIDWLARHVDSYPDMQEASVWLDGFAGFMPQEYAVIEKLIKMSRVTVSLTIDPESVGKRLRDEHLFFPTWDTLQKLRHMAQVAMVERLPSVMLGERHRFAKNKAIAQIETFLRERTLPASPVVHEGVTVVSAATRRIEVDAAAREIVRLCREEGLRYREICLVVRDLAVYENLLSTIFADYDIPIFVDKKRLVRHHPLLDLLSSALALVQENFPYEVVMRFLKTGLLGASPSSIDNLDNFLLATGFRGSRWLNSEDWVLRPTLSEDEPDHLAVELNALRRQIQPYFMHLHTQLSASQTVHDFTDALQALLESLGVAETLESWVAETEAEQDVLGARVHAQVYSAALETLLQLDEILGTTEMPLAEYALILEAGLQGLQLGLIPPSIDQVFIAEAGRSRAPEVMAALVLGLNDGVFPMRIASQGVFSDSEKEHLAAMGLDLGMTARRKVFEEQFLLYTGLTLASHRLWLSYATADDKGTALVPSAELESLLPLFPGLKVRYENLEMPSESDAVLTRLVHPRVTLGSLGLSLRQAKAGISIPPLWWDVYSHLLGSPQWQSATRQIAQALFYTNIEPPLSGKQRKSALPRLLRGSVSRIEQFNACPFAYFAAFTLKLRERKVFKLEAIDIGNFYHAALEIFGTKLESRQLTWRDVDEAISREISAEIANELQPSMRGSILTSTKRHGFLAKKLQRVVERSALALARHAKQGRFEPLAVELGFGHDGRLPALTITLTDGTVMELTGRIDRVDCAQGKSGIFLRVMDFKSGANKLTLSEVYYGLRLQLLTYLEVMLLHGKAIIGEDALPAGALYFQVHDPIISSNRPLSPSDAAEQILLAYRTTGIIVDNKEVIPLMDSEIDEKSVLVPITLNRSDRSPKKSADVWSPEQLAAMREHITALYREAGQKIASGNIDIAPTLLNKQAACTYCRFKAVCQFDPLLEGNRFREMPKLKPEQVWKALGVKEGGGEDVDDRTTPSH